MGLSGIISRAASICLDGRLLGYEGYDKYTFSIYLGSNSDCLDRYQLRYNEILEALRLIYTMIYSMFSSMVGHSADSVINRGVIN